MRRGSPDTVILIDEAYHDYVLIRQRDAVAGAGHAHVFVARTFQGTAWRMRIAGAIGRLTHRRSRAKMP